MSSNDFINDLLEEQKIGEVSFDDRTYGAFADDLLTDADYMRFISSLDEVEDYA